MPLAVIHALALIKKAAARVNDHLANCRRKSPG